MLKYVRSANIKGCYGQFQIMVTLETMTMKKKGQKIHGQPSLLRGLIVHIDRASCCLLSKALCSRELCRRCNDRLIPAFVECDEEGGKGGAELS